MFEVERRTGTGGSDLLLVASSVTVRPVLLPLTPRGVRPQPQELLRHLDLLDVGEGVVPLAIQHHGHRICHGNELRLIWTELIFILIVWR